MNGGRRNRLLCLGLAVIISLLGASASSAKYPAETTQVNQDLDKNQLDNQGPGRPGLDSSGIDLHAFDQTAKRLHEVQTIDAEGNQVAEFSTNPLATTGSTNVATLIQTIDAFNFNPPSPDTSGIAFIEASGTYLVSDSEVDEIADLFTGDNLFEIMPSGTLIDTTTTISYSNEPTGVAYNPNNDHVFFSDDVALEVYEITPGDDGQYGTSDDVLTHFDTKAFNSHDPEGITFDSIQGVLFIVDGISTEVYRVFPGSNGVFDGVAPAGDDQVSHFDTANMGITDPEGITFNPDNGNLFIVGKPATSLLELTTSGTPVRMYDISAADPDKPAGLAYGPSSLDLSQMSIYITDRGVDNNTNPGENDGEIYELSLPPITAGNQPPNVNAGSDQTVIYPNNATLNGSASDDGIPNPSPVKVTWAQVSGPGTVTFSNPKSTNTTASFPTSGTYVLRLIGDDGELLASDDVTVVSQNIAPVADNDTFNMIEDTTLNEPAPGVLEGDTDANGDTLTAELVNNVSHGSLTLNSDGSFDYTPDHNYFGTDTFTYHAFDGKAYSNTATVNITVQGVNDAPEAVDDSFIMNENTELNIMKPGVLENDSDPDGDNLSVYLEIDAPNGDLILKSNGSFFYKPHTNFNGDDSFVYYVYDGQAESNRATVTITIQAVNSPPVAVDDAYSLDEDGSLSVSGAGVLNNDQNSDGDPLTAILVSDVSHGNLNLNPSGSFDYTPDPNYNGMDTFTYMANDGTYNSNVATATITVRAVDDKPTAGDDAFVTLRDTTLVVDPPGVLGNDDDVDGDPLVAFWMSNPSHGNLTPNADGSFIYVPEADYTGTDTFTYLAYDGRLSSSIATVTITVKVNNNPPVAGYDTFSTGQGLSLTIVAPGVLGNDSDPDGDNIMAVLATGPGQGTLNLNPDGSFTYTPDAGFEGIDAFTYRASDGAADSNVATVTIEVISLMKIYLPVVVDH